MIQKHLVVLGVLLNELGIPHTITGLQDRLRVQKAVYLAQSVAGVDLGYRYGWYIKGPYSPSLTRDYYALDEALIASENALEGFALRGGIKRQLIKLKGHLKPPDGVEIDQPEWLELLASVDYLKRVSSASDEDVRSIIAKSKAHLIDHVDAGLNFYRAVSSSSPE